MVIHEQEELVRMLGGASRVLVLTKERPGYDEGAAALALFLWLTTHGKKRLDICLPGVPAGKFRFLPGASDVREDIQAADQFVIRVNIAHTKAKELSYDIVGDALEVRVKPSGGNFTPADVSFAESSFAYDMIVTVGVPELPALGDLFERNRELFFNTPVINIDRHAKNIRFGHLNIVYLHAASLAEIVHGVIAGAMTPDIAQCLLTSLIAATNSFQTPHVTPATLQLASDCIVAGATQQDIVQHLYRTKDIERLKVWGAILSRIKQVDTRLVYSSIDAQAMEHGDIDLQSLVDDLVLVSPEADIVMFFYEMNNKETRVMIYARDNYDTMVLLQPFKPVGNRREASCVFAGTREEAETAIVRYVREQVQRIRR